MSSINDMVDGLAELETDEGAMLNYDGLDYPCLGGDRLDGRLLQEFGFQTNSQLTIVARTSVFPSGKIPESKQTIIFTSTPGDSPVKLRIADAHSFRGAILVLACESPNQGS